MKLRILTSVAAAAVLAVALSEAQKKADTKNAEDPAPTPDRQASAGKEPTAEAYVSPDAAQHFRIQHKTNRKPGARPRTFPR